MIRNIVITAIALISALCGYSQDIIVMRDKQEIPCSIQEISADSIKFIPKGDNDLYAVPKTAVSKVIFSNGIEEYFGGEAPSDYYYNQREGEFSEERKDIVHPYDKIYLTDGTVIEGQVLEKKRFGINYVPLNAPDNEIAYIANTKVAKVVYADGTVEYISGSASDEKPGKQKKAPRDFSYLSPSYVSLTVGPSLPFGIYSSTAGIGGFAGTGFSFDADFTYYLFRGMGFGAIVGATSNGFDSKIFRTQLSQDFPNSTSDIGNWWHMYTLAGIGYYNDFGRLLIDYKALAGAMYSFFPSTEVFYTENGDQMRVTLNSKAVSFAFGATTSLRYYITRKWSVKGSLLMLFGRPKFPGIIRKDYVNGEPGVESVYQGVFDQQVSVINFTVGAAYTIGR